MRQAIMTYFLSPTNTKGTRIKARAFAGSITIARDYELDDDQNLALAMLALCRKYKWDSTFYVPGALDLNNSVVWVCVEQEWIKKMGGDNGNG